MMNHVRSYHLTGAITIPGSSPESAQRITDSLYIDIYAPDAHISPPETNQKLTFRFNNVEGGSLHLHDSGFFRDAIEYPTYPTREQTFAELPVTFDPETSLKPVAAAYREGEFTLELSPFKAGTEYGAELTVMLTDPNAIATVSAWFSPKQYRDLRNALETNPAGNPSMHEPGSVVLANGTENNNNLAPPRSQR